MPTEVRDGVQAPASPIAASSCPAQGTPAVPHSPVDLRGMPGQGPGAPHTTPHTGLMRVREPRGLTGFSDADMPLGDKAQVEINTHGPHTGRALCPRSHRVALQGGSSPRARSQQEEAFHGSYVWAWVLGAVPQAPLFPIRTGAQRPGCSKRTASHSAPALTVPKHQS